MGLWDTTGSGLQGLNRVKLRLFKSVGRSAVRVGPRRHLRDECQVIENDGLFRFLLPENLTARLIHTRQLFAMQVTQAIPDFGGRNAEGTFAECVHAATVVDDDKVAPVAACQDQSFLVERRLKAPAGIGVIETFPDDFSGVMDIETEPAGLLVFCACRRVPDRALALVRDRRQPEMLFKRSADFLETLLVKRQRLRRQAFGINPGPGQMHVKVAGIFGDMEGDCARLIRQPEHSLDAGGGVFPLLAVEYFPLAIPDIDVEERGLAFRTGGNRKAERRQAQLYIGLRPMW